MAATKEGFEELGLKVAKRLTRKLVIDAEGNIHSFWGEGEGIQHHVFDNIRRAIDQHLDILEKYGENLMEIKVIPGEKQRIEQSIRRLHRLVEDLMNPSLSSSSRKEEIQQDIDWIVAEIGRTTNKNKQLAKTKLEQLTTEPLMANKKGYFKPILAIPISEAETDLLRRYLDILDKIKGTLTRLQRLLNERYRSLKTIVSVRRQLGRFLLEFENGRPPGDERLKKIAKQICGGKSNLVVGLESIIVKPYITRIRSPEIQRLKRAQIHLNRYLETHKAKNLKTFYNTLLLAYRKLGTPSREYERQKRKKPKSIKMED